MISIDEAIELVRNTSKFSHVLIVSAMMKKLAERLGENNQEWELTGILHDLDIDFTRNDMSKHGVIAAKRLKGKLPENCLYAIKAHDFRTRFNPKSCLDKALIAVDSMAVLTERIKKHACIERAQTYYGAVLASGGDFIMDVLDAIKSRKSVRRYLDKSIEKEKLIAVLEAGRLAPSASNRQEWRFVIVRDRETRRKLAEAADEQAFVGEAPVVIVACAETDGHIMKCRQPCYPIDVAIALDHITLAAVELGLGTCWIGAFDEKSVKEILGIPEEIRVVELMPLGYPSDPSIVKKERLSLDTIVKYEHW